MRFIIGLDLGQMQDYTAIAVAERLGKSKKDRAYHLRHLERFELGTSYPDVVKRVKELVNTEPLKRNAKLVADATGVGVPVVDMLWQAGLSLIPVLITGGDSVSTSGIFWKAPKRDLITQLQVLLQSGRLKIAEGLPESLTLINELLAFKVKITASANDTYGVWREGVHDDLVLAAALAVWWGQLSGEGATVKAYVC
jgi:terminase large subunit-like protein